jgi:predicted transcriptional regulator
MAREIELDSLDLRYEGFRLKESAVEGKLLASIAQRGIEEPLEGVEVKEVKILLNGFKRLRCARKLRLATVPYGSLGQDEVVGIVSLLRTSHKRVLSILEEAAFVTELKNTRQMNVAQIASELSRSKAWVNVRLGLLIGMSEKVRQKLFSGAFPAYAYMNPLRHCMRITGVTQAQVDELVLALSGHGLSVREVTQLAHGCFRGPESLRQEILKGNFALPLQWMQQAAQKCPECSDFERIMLDDLEKTQKYMQRVMGKSLDPQLKSRAFHAQSHLLSAAIISRSRAFVHTLKKLYDRSGQA